MATSVLEKNPTADLILGPKKIKYLVQIFYFVSQFMINAHHHLFVADIVVALIQFLGVLRQKIKQKIKS